MARKINSNYVALDATAFTGNLNNIDQLQDAMVVLDDLTLTWGNIDGDINNQQDLQDALDAKAWVVHGHQIDEVENLWDRLRDRPTIGEHVDITTGVPDAGKAVKLNSLGVLDASMIPIEGGWTNQGEWQPGSGQEYPPTGGLPSGSFWAVVGVDDTNGYTFTAGGLAGQTAYNGNLMVWAGGSWSLKVTDLNPFEYYKLDGTQAITGPFAGGGQQFKNAADAIDPTDLVTLQQLEQNGGGIPEAPTDGVIYGRHNADWTNLYTTFTTLTQLQNHVDADNPHNITPAEIGAEPSLGNPTVNDQVLTSDVNGSRSWITLPNVETPLNGDAFIPKLVSMTWADVQTELESMPSNFAGHEVHIRLEDGEHPVGDEDFVVFGKYNGRLYIEAFNSSGPGATKNASIIFNGSGTFIFDRTMLDIDFAHLEIRLTPDGSTVPIQISGLNVLASTKNYYNTTDASNNSSIVYAWDTQIASNSDTFEGNGNFNSTFITFAKGTEIAQVGDVTIMNAGVNTTAFTYGVSGPGTAAFSASDAAFTTKVTDEAIDITAAGAGGGIPDAPSDTTFYGRKDAGWVNPDISDIDGLQADLDNRRIGKETYIADIALPIGEYLHIARIDDLSSAMISCIVDSNFLAPAFTLNVFHVYDTVKYEFGLTHYSLAAEPQFDQLIFTQAANGAPINIYLRISSIKDPADISNIALSANYTKTDDTVAGLTLFGTTVNSISDVELTVDITSKDFRSTNVAPSPITFKGLKDTPTSFLNQDGRILRVREDLDTLEFIDHSFLALTDTPVDYTGHAGAKVMVNDTEDGIEFIPDVEIGSVEVNYKWSTDVDATEPASGRIKGNNADYTLITEFYISETDRNGKARDGMLQALDGGDVIVFRDANSESKYITCIVNQPGATDNGTWWTIPVTYVKSGPDDFNNGENGVVGIVYLATKHFINLHDTPDDYTGHAGELVKVNSAEDGVEFDANSPVSTDVTFGGFKHTFDSSSGTLNLYTT